VRCATDATSTEKLLMLLKITALMPGSVLADLGRQWYQETNGDLYKLPVQLIENVAKAIKTGQNSQLNLDDKSKMDSYILGLQSLKNTFDAADANNIHVLVDAEYTHINQGLSVCALALSLLYNENRGLVYNTYQCYLKSTEQRFNSELNYIKSNGIHFGAKVVRGAYLVWEKENALKKGLSCPIQESYEETSDCYNKISGKLIDLAKQDKKVEGMVASHNETSILKAITKMQELGLPKKGPITFGQIYGMSDNISITLAKNGYKVYKVLSYGTVDETLPFLVRRAQENKFIFNGIRNERQLLQQAYKLK